MKTLKNKEKKLGSIILSIFQIPLRYRTIHPLVVQAVVFLILLILVFVPGSNGMFWFIIVLSLIAGGATSIFQSGMFGLAGMLPSRYTQVCVCVYVLF